MGEAGKIRPDQLRTARTILSELPVKDNRCSREQAAAFLEKDLKRAFRKGYSPKELCALFKKAGIIIPERLVARYQERDEGAEENRSFMPGKRRTRGKKESLAPSQNTEHRNAAEVNTSQSEDEGKLQTKSGSELHGADKSTSAKPEDTKDVKAPTSPAENEPKPELKPQPARHGTTPITSEKAEESRSTKDTATPTENEAQPQPKPASVRHETSRITPDKTEDANVAKVTTSPPKNEAKSKPKPEPVRYGTFPIIPDTPIGEL